MFKKYWRFFKPYIVIGGAISSICTVIALLIDNTQMTIILLVVVCLFFLIILLRVLQVLERFVEKNHSSEVVTLSTSFEFIALTKHDFKFEVYKHIKSKRTILSEFQQPFNWSGSKKPNYSSKLQEIRRVSPGDDNGQLVVVKFPTPLTFNNYGVIHIMASMNDPENLYDPHITCKVDKPVSIVTFRIVLRYRNSNFRQKAKVQKKRISSTENFEWKTFRRLEFDGITKSYEYHLINVEVGYYYRIVWIK